MITTKFYLLIKTLLDNFLDFIYGVLILIPRYFMKKRDLSSWTWISDLVLPQSSVTQASPHFAFMDKGINDGLEFNLGDVFWKAFSEPIDVHQNDLKTCKC